MSWNSKGWTKNNIAAKRHKVHKSEAHGVLCFLLLFVANNLMKNFQIIQNRSVLLALSLIILLLNTSVLSQDGVKVLVVYYSVEGHTRSMGEAVARGAREVAGTEVKLLSVSDATAADVVWADGIIVGSPVHNAAVAPEVQKFINSWPFQGTPLRNKIGAAFTTGGGISAGEEVVQLSILHSMLIFGMVVVGGPEWNSSFGASAVTNEGPFRSRDGKVDSLFLKKGRALGKRVAELAARFRISRQK